MNLAVNAQRIEADLEALAQFSETPSPSITRIVFSPADVTARSWLKEQCSAAGLDIREDAIGNLFARWNGSDPSLPAVATGSHIDAIPNSGRFDGTVGVLGGLEAIRTLRESGYVPRRSIELIMFTSEEPTRFGLGCLGSRMLSGVLSADKAANLKDLELLRRSAGFQGPLESVQLSPGSYSTFIELHIEQGPLLEAQKLDIGVVTSIAAPAALRLLITGNGGHAGAVLMQDRHDALVGAAEIISSVEDTAHGTGSADSVATTGVCEVFPGAVNSIPSKVKLEIDIRDSELERRDAMVERVQDAVNQVAVRRGLKVEVELLNSDAPATCDPTVIATVVQACQDLNLRHQQMVSRAYHDSLFMSRIAPTGMIFIPCHKGYSHRPDEFASTKAISQGAAVLAQTLAALAV